MALRLLQAGFAVTVWNRTASKCAPLLAAGASVAATPAQAVATADVVLTMLADGAAMLAVFDDARAAIARNALVIDMSSTSQAEALALHARCAADGLACLDAPVSGGVLGAQAGSLAIMAGASAENFQRAAPIFAALGKATRVGGAGTGQVAKLCNQLIVGATLNIVAEALLLAQSAGADPAAVRDALAGGFAASRILEVHGQRMLTRDFRPGGQMRTQLKDLDNVLLAAADAGLALPLADLVRQHYQHGAALAGGADHSAILLTLEERNGKRLGAAPDQLPDA
ncbi:MAG: NAD(P)-dependent oxidoreductase [Pseudomonadota bacterium]|nr:NAD(P)-dependent oxidoreductase [Pseudomonadota bacterium]